MTTPNPDHRPGVDPACCQPARSPQKEAFGSNLESCCSVATDSVASAAMDDLVEASVTSPEVDALRSAGFRLLFDGGQPVDVDQWAAAAGVVVESLHAIIETSGAKGRVQFDADGSLVGIAGLSVERTRHELNIDGKIRWTWCALDAIGILGALEATGTVRSTDPQTDAAVEV
ncbi:MAG: organomercurial lyase, partial [Actinomycetia bacterium]|nr:organomercurial lyase [Actinomycetes bacterium]